MLCLPGLLLPEHLSLQQATADPYLNRRPSNTQRQVYLSLLWGITASFPQSWWHKVLFALSECLWWVRGLILNAIAPFLLSCCGFSFDLGYGVSLFGRFQHSPVDGCSAASCNFDVLTGEDEHMCFYSAILKIDHFPWVLWELSVKCLDTGPSRCSLNLDYHCIWLLGRTFWFLWQSFSRNLPWI